MAHSGTIIHMRNVPGDPTLRALDAPLPLKNMDGTDDEVPTDYVWNGASGNWFTHKLFPRHDHPIATCRHDYRCDMAKTPEERLFADKEFKKDVGTTAGWWEQTKGYVGVRIGAFFGIGNNF